MSKSDETLDRIELTNAYKEQINPSFSHGKLINAFDTETSDGDVFMLSYAIGDMSGVIGNESVEALDSSEIFDKITNRQCRSALNCWYNLDFDANALLSGILDRRELTELTITNGTTTEVDGIEYEIRYVKSKFLRIRDSNKNIYAHYDVSQFFYTSLDNAAEEWLGKNKIEEVDASKFGTKPCDNCEEVDPSCSDCWSKQQAIQYVQKHYEVIADYAEKDALLTQELAQELILEGESLDIPMGKPISTGYLSAEYLRENTDTKPSFYNRDIQRMFWDSYYGGRFEVFKRGNVGEIAAPDINSAYPAIMQNLPDPSTLEWERYSNQLENDGFGFDASPFNFNDVCKADYGVVRAIVTTDPNNPIQPFAYKIDGKVNYPILTDTEITVIKPIFEFAVKNGLVLDYELEEAWLGNEIEGETKYPFEFIGDMYSQRKVFEVLDGLLKKGQLLKIILNSLYGKTCQTTELTSIVDLAETGEIELEEHEKVQPKDYLSLNQREELTDDEIIIGAQTAGRRFNPFFASYITGMTRLELHKQVVEHDLVDETVMFATDCLMVEKEAYDNSDFDELIKVPNDELDRDEFRKVAKESLGFWDFDYKGEGFVVGSGVYEVDTHICKNKECEHYKTKDCENRNHRIKTKTRGFLEKNLDGSLVNMAKNNPSGIPLENTRPLTIAEVLIKPDRGNVSQFIKESKTLTATFDTKRNWQNDDATFTDLLNGVETSMPINLAEIEEKRMRKAQEALEKAEEMSKGEIQA